MVENRFTLPLSKPVALRKFESWQEKDKRKEKSYEETFITLNYREKQAFIWDKLLLLFHPILAQTITYSISAFKSREAVWKYQKV